MHHVLHWVLLAFAPFFDSSFKNKQGKELRSIMTVIVLCRYDDLKTAQENIDLQSTILSRFDLIFIVKDERSIEKDQRIARWDYLSLLYSRAVHETEHTVNCLSQIPPATARRRAAAVDVHGDQKEAECCSVLT